jgi:hypothetical protein
MTFKGRSEISFVNTVFNLRLQKLGCVCYKALFAGNHIMNIMNIMARHVLRLVQSQSQSQFLN